MSSVGEGDKLRIPIEIKTEDVKEIDELINKISDAESGLDRLKPLKGKTGDTTSRSAFAREEPFDDRGGIFSRDIDGSVLPQQIRDKKSRAPYQRQNEFKELQENVQSLQETQGDMVQNLVNLGFVSQVGGLGSRAGGKIHGVMKSGQAPLKNFMATGAMGAMGLGGGIKGLIGKAGVYGMIALVAYEMIQTVIGQLLTPGGPLDRRFKRDIKKESVRLMELDRKEEISTGRRIVRVTTNSNLRGVGQARSNLDYYKNGQRIFDLDGQLLSKNIGVGDV